MNRLNKQEFEYLYNLYKGKPTIKSKNFEEINQKLVTENYIDDNNITQKGIDYLADYKIENAIILAAGTSSRFVPICFDIPKGLLNVKGEVLIERQIRQLKEVGIDDITIVVGYKKEMFEYLKGKYGVKLVFNPDYAIKNNYSSVYLVKDRLRNSIITSSDLYFSNNIFESHAYDAFYCAIYQEGKTEERGLITDENDKIINTSYNCHDIWVSLGYAYFSKRFSDNFIEIVDKINNLPETMNKFWADIQDEHLDKLFMYIKRCSNNEIYEFDSLAELKEFDKDFKAAPVSETMQLICKQLNVLEDDLKNFQPIEMTTRIKVAGFECKGEKYKYVYDTDKKTCEIINLSQEEIKDSKTFQRHKKMEELKNIIISFNSDQDITLPLCAAENVMSDFCKIPLNSNFQERYIMGSENQFKMDGNFIGSEYLLPFYERISLECKELYQAKYTDARTLTGMNCLTMLIMSLMKIGDNIMVLDKQYGGHASVVPILERLGINVFYAPYDLEKYDFDYAKLNQQIKENNIKFFITAASDILFPLDITKIDDTDLTVLFDASQTLGLIAAGIHENPLPKMKNVIMFGGTHKTIPGPAHGLVLTNNKELYDILDAGINPKYLRNTQMHQVISLLFTLIEMQYYGKDYQINTVRMGNVLGKYLEEEGLNVVKRNNVYTTTHQVFIECPKSQMDTIFNHAITERITLNTKTKPLFKGGYGIRLGLQEISRYAWDNEALKNIAKILKMISQDTYNSNDLHKLLKALPPKKIHFTFEDEEVRDLIKACNVFSHYKL